MVHQDVVYRKPYYVEHYCKFWVVKKTIRDTVMGKKWFEKCKCGRSVMVECCYVVEGTNSPTITKHWYDKEGNFEKKTGYKPDN